MIHVSWSPVWSFHSQWWFGLPCHLLVLVHCEVQGQRSHLPGHLEHFILPSADKLYGNADFIFQQDLAPAHTAKGTKSWFNDHVLLCLIGQQTHQTWTQRETRGETPDPTMQMTWRPLSEQPGLHYTWAVSQTDCLDATPHRCSNSCKRSPN